MTARKPKRLPPEERVFRALTKARPLYFDATRALMARLRAQAEAERDRECHAAGKLTPTARREFPLAAALEDAPKVYTCGACGERRAPCGCHSFTQDGIVLPVTCEQHRARRLPSEVPFPAGHGFAAERMQGPGMAINEAGDVEPGE